jgi:hypothetical protein
MRLRYCPGCHTANPAEALACEKCGFNLNTPPAKAPTVAPDPQKWVCCVCGAVGPISPSLKGEGPYYCGEHAYEVLFHASGGTLAPREEVEKHIASISDMLGRAMEARKLMTRRKPAPLRSREPGEDDE